MAYSNLLDGVAGPPAVNTGQGLTPHRCYRWGTATLGELLAPAAGGDVDAIAGLATYAGPPADTASVAFLAVAGLMVRIEAAASFGTGNLEVTSDGRVQSVSTGKVIARSLEASSGAGDVVWCAIASGR